MNIRLLLPAAALLLAGGCAMQPRVEVKKEPLARLASFPAAYSAEVGPVDVDIESLVPKFDDAKPSEELVSIEMRLVELPADLAADAFGVGSGTEVFTAATPRLDELISVLRGGGQVAIISAPRLTCFDEQRANITVANESSYVSSYEIREEKGVKVADPVIETVVDGMVFAVKTKLAGDAVEIELNAVSCDLVKPMARKQVVLANGHTAEIELPVLNVQKVQTRATVAPGVTLLLSSVSNGNGRVKLLLLTASKLRLEEGK